MLVSSIARFNAMKSNASMVQTQSCANSFNGVQNKPQTINPFSLNNLKSAIQKLNVLA